MNNSVKRKNKFLNYFGENVDFKREFIAGMTSFLAMAYIIAVNPSILGDAGMNPGAVVTATCLSAVSTSTGCEWIIPSWLMHWCGETWSVFSIIWRSTW